MPAEDDLRADIQRAYEQLQSGQELQQPQVEKVTKTPVSPGQTRHLITMLVVCAYLLYAIAVGAFIIVSGDASKVSPLIDIMKTLLLPIVTLVIGYYFGASRTD